MNYKKIVILSALVFSGSFVSAQGTDTGVVTNEPIKKEIRLLKDDMRMERKENLSDFKDKRIEIKADAKAQMELGRKERKEQMGDNRAEMKEDRAMMKEEMQAKRAEMKKEMEENRAERKEALKEAITKVKKEKLEVRKGFVVARYSAAIKALGDKQVRVQAFIDAQKGKGVDVVKAQEHLTLSISSLKAAQTDLDTLKAQAAVSETTKDQVKALSVKVEESLKKSRSELVSAVQAAASVSVDASAGTTVQ